jgi:DNA-binding PadR family transcriptional regulator
MKKNLAVKKTNHESRELTIARTASDVSNDLDKVVHERNISVHARKLEEAGYLTCEKSFRGRTPLTEYAITTAGRKALGNYLDHMEALIKAMKKV